MRTRAARWYGVLASLSSMVALATLFQLSLPRLRSEWIASAIDQHNLVLRGTAGNPWQYRILSDYLIAPVINLLLAPHNHDPYLYGLFGFVLVRGAQMVGIFGLGFAYFRKLGLPPITSLAGLAVVCVAMVVGQIETSWQLDAYTDVVLYLLAAICVLSRRVGLVLPVAVLAGLNRETGLFIPLMPLALVNVRALRSSANVPVYRLVGIGAVLFVLVQSGLHVGLPAQDQSTRLVPEVLSSPFRIRGGFAYLAIALGVIPLVASLGLRVAHQLVRFLFWLIVPVWMAAHAWGNVPMTPLPFLVPLALVFVPSALFTATAVWRNTQGFFGTLELPATGPAQSRVAPDATGPAETRRPRGARPTGSAASDGLVAHWETVAAMAVVYLLGPLVAGLVRLDYPFPLERIEGTMVQELRRVALGQGLYVAPTLDYVPLLYAPVYVYVSAGVATLTGASLLPLRIVAFAAALASAALVYRLVARDAPGQLPGFLAAGLFLGTTQLTPTDRFPARVDALCLLLVLAAITAARNADRQPRAAPQLSALCGLLVGLAILTKQTAAVVGVPLMLLALPRFGARLLPYVAAAAATLLVAAVALFASSGGWARFYLVDLPRNHGVEWSMILGLWTQYLLPHAAVALVFGAAFLVVRARHGDFGAVRFYAFAAAGLIGMSWVSVLNPGGGVNSMGAAYAGVAMLFGLGFQASVDLARARFARRRALPVGLFVAATLELAALQFSVDQPAPLRANARAGERLVAAIAALPGEVFAPDLEEYQWRAGKRDHATAAGVQELLGSFGGTTLPEGRQYLDALDRALSDRQYAYVLFDPEGFDPALKGMLGFHGYELVGPLMGRDDVFTLWRQGSSSGGGYLTPAPLLYAPRNRAG